MSVNGWLQFAIYSVILLATVRPVGIYLTRVLEGERTWLDPVLRPFERLIYKLCAVNADKEMNWREYTFAMLGFSAVGLLLTYALERLQGFMQGAWGWANPQHLAAVGPDLAWNTAASFTTNTNWQFYTPESTMSYLTEMAGTGDAQLLVGCRGHRGCRGAHPRHQAHAVEHHRQLLGRYDADVALYPHAGVHRLRAAAGLAGSSAESPSLHRRAYRRRQHADHRPGAGGFAGSHQDAGHERRRILQCQQRPSL